MVYFKRSIQTVISNKITLKLKGPHRAFVCTFVTGASIHFSDGGGAKVRKISNFSARCSMKF